MTVNQTRTGQAWRRHRGHCHHPRQRRQPCPARAAYLYVGPTRLRPRAFVALRSFRLRSRRRSSLRVGGKPPTTPNSEQPLQSVEGGHALRRRRLNHAPSGRVQQPLSRLLYAAAVWVCPTSTMRVSEQELFQRFFGQLLAGGTLSASQAHAARCIAGCGTLL